MFSVKSIRDTFILCANVEQGSSLLPYILSYARHHLLHRFSLARFFGSSAASQAADLQHAKEPIRIFQELIGQKQVISPELSAYDFQDDAMNLQLVIRSYDNGVHRRIIGLENNRRALLLAGLAAGLHRR